MARYTDSVCRLCRREGAKLFLKGDALLYQEVRLRAPAHAARPARRPPSQGRRLRHPAAREAEGPPRLRRARAAVPQLLRRRGVPPGRDRREPAAARSSCAWTTSSTGWASRRPATHARQLVSHGHFAVNGRPTNIPSYQLKPGDRIEVRESHRAREPFKIAKETLRSHQAPDWLTVDPVKLSGSVVAAAPPRPDAARSSTSSSSSSTTRGNADDRTRGSAPRSNRSPKTTGTPSTRPARSRPATASPSATRSGASSSRRSRARPSPRSRSATSTRSSRRSPASRRTSPRSS